MATGYRLLMGYIDPFWAFWEMVTTFNEQRIFSWRKHSERISCLCHCLTEVVFLAGTVQGWPQHVMNLNAG